MEAMGAVENVVTLDIPAKPEYVAVGRLALAALLREAAFSDDAVADMKLALTEACSNSIRHAFGEANGQVHLTFTLDGERLVLGVRDEGVGFAEEEVEAAAFTPGSTTNLPEGGMGFSIIRAVVDEFTLEHPAAGGTQLTMTKLKRA
jgi:serine/threonine-protein kinase RsbW